MDGSINIPHTEIEARAAELPEDTAVPVVVFCAKGHLALNPKWWEETPGKRHQKTDKKKTDKKKTVAKLY